MQFIKKQFGFTLIEVMVSVSIFTIVVTVGIGSLMTVNKAYRQSQLQRAAIDNVSFAMESMAREIRIGTRYAIGPTVSGPYDRENDEAGKFSFRSFDINNDNVVGTDDDVMYLWNNPNGYGVIEMYIDGAYNGDLTSSDVDVTNLVFVLEECYDSSSCLSNYKQPYVSIHISAVARGNNQESSIVLQTSVSQREVNKDPA